MALRRFANTKYFNLPYLTPMHKILVLLISHYSFKNKMRLHFRNTLSRLNLLLVKDPT